MDRIKETIDKCISVLRKAPSDISRRVEKLFCQLYDFLREHPEFSESAFPIIFRLYRCILDGNYAEAFNQLFHLLVLVAARKNKK